MPACQHRVAKGMVVTTQGAVGGDGLPTREAGQVSTTVKLLTELLTADRTDPDWDVRFRRSYPVGTLGLRSGLLHDEAPVGSPEDLRQIPGVIPDGIAAVEEGDELEDPGQPEAPLSPLSASRV